MKRLAIAGLIVIALIGAGRADDKQKNKEAKSAPKRVALTAEQVRMMKDLEQAVKEAEREYRQRVEVIKAQAAGALSVIAQQGGMGNRDYKLVPEGDGMALEEILKEEKAANGAASQPGSAAGQPGASQAAAPAQPGAQPGAAPEKEKEKDAGAKKEGQPKP